MPIRPPEPTTNKLPPSEASTQRHAAIVPVILGLLLVLALAGGLTWKRSMKVLIVPYQVSQLANLDPDDSGSAPLFLNQSDNSQGAAQTPNPHAVEDFLQLDPGDMPLDAEPAELPIPPQGQRLTGLMRNQGNQYEEITQWLIPASHIAPVLDEYRQAAAQQYFEELTRSAATPDATPAASPDASPQNMTRSIIMTRTRRPGMSENDKLPQGNDILVIRAKQITPDRVHLTLWYRYSHQGRPVR